MQATSRRFIRSVQALVGAVIGVGIFGLPYVFAQAGFAIGMGHLIVLGGVNLVMLLAYADIVMNTPGESRLVGMVQMYMGHHWSWLMTFALFLSTWGAMVAYIILGGEFVHALVAPWLGGEAFVYQLLFAAVVSFVLIGGLSMISRLEVVFVGALIVLLALMIAGAVPHADLSNLMTVNVEKGFAPFGVLLFAYGGLAIIPEMEAILGRDNGLLRKAVVVAFLMITAVYVLFVAAVIGVTGAGTTQEAILGLGEVIGPWALTLGALIGLASVTTSFLILGVQLMGNLMHDYKQRYFVAWGVSAGVPVAVFLLGARSFIDVIGFTGGILAAAVGLITIRLYLKAKRHACTPKRCLAIPHWILYVSAAVLFAGMIATAFGL